MLDFGFYNMDCMEGMKQFPDKYFDLAIVDPPYGDGGGQWKRQDKSRFGGVFDRYRKDRIPRQSVLARAEHGRANSAKKSLRGIQPRSRNILKSCFVSHGTRLSGGGNYFKLPPTRCFLIWRKTNVPEKFSMAMCEYAWTSFNDNAKMFSFSAVGQEGRFHPTQKPPELYGWILENYSQPKDIILDTHVGSASSLIACRETGHKYVGFEIDPDYYAMAKKRLDVAEAQGNIFDFLETDQ